MYSHKPPDYHCPFCMIVRGVEGDYPYTKQADIVYQDAAITTWVASHQWPKNRGHVLIVPNKHFENIYDLPDELLAKIAVLSKQVALAFKETYGCDGVSTRQHNEPAGGQDVWHYHLHVFPRYTGDNLYEDNAKIALIAPASRLPYAQKLQQWFAARRI
jgi:histidine triad (HIT) family protein